MKNSIIFFLIIFITGFPSEAVSFDEGFTQKDRELLIELKVRMTEIDKRFEQIDKRFEQIDKRFEQVDKRLEQVDKRFEQVDKRFEEIIHFMYILAGIFTSLVIATLGFGYWDRRTAIKEARREVIEYIEKEGLIRRIVDVMKELAKEDIKIESALKKFNIL